MNRFEKSVLCVFVVILAATTFGRSAEAKTPVEGVWELTELTPTGPNATTNKNPQPGYMIFTDRYYSIVTVNSDKPRAELPQDVNTASATQLREAWGPFTAQTGTYEVKGSELILRPLAAKNPAAMRSGNFNVNTFKIEGNVLTIVQKANQNGPAANPTPRRFTRVE